MAVHRASVGLSCWVCSIECLSYKQLKKHYKKKHQEYDLVRCLFCKFVTVSQSDIKKHKKQEHLEDRFTCNSCQFSTRSCKKWKKHEATGHPRERQPNTAADAHEIPSSQCHHASRHVDGDSLLDFNSGRREREQGQKTDHDHASLSTNSVMTDPSLELGSSSATNLDIALNDSTLQNVSKSASLTSLPAYCSKSAVQGLGVQLKCPQCASTQQRTEQEASACSFCGFSGENWHSLPSLGDSSTRKSLYVCELCKKQFVKKISLTYHMRTHTNDRPFQCEYCDYTSSLKTTLEQHLRGHLGIKPYKCEICEYTTAYKSNLVFHAVTHSVDRPFSCNFCHKKFKRKDHMANHVKRKHADIM